MQHFKVMHQTHVQQYRFIIFCLTLLFNRSEVYCTDVCEDKCFMYGAWW